MTWDGQPEHRNLHRGDGESVPDLSAGASAARYLADAAARHAEARRRAEAWRQAEAARSPQPDAGMPLDPFTGSVAGAIAQAEMFRSLVEGGFTEPQALYYLACLVQVGLAMQLGKFTGLPPWPPEQQQ